MENITLMLVVQVIPNKGWALDKIMSLVKEGDGIEIRRHYMDTMGNYVDFNGADIVEYGLWGNLPFEKVQLPSLVTIHHIEKKDAEDAKKRLAIAKPKKIIAVNPITKKALKKIGFKSEVIPISTYPREFRVGYLGRDIPSKRFDVIDEACRRLKDYNVVCVGKRRNEVSDSDMTEDELNKWYRSLNVFVSADLEIPGSMCNLEAVANGTPVLCTKNTYYPHKDNATHFNGSVEDLVKKIKKMIPKPLITAEEYSNKYREIYKWLKQQS